MPKPEYECRIRLPNGLPATVYRLDDDRMRRIAEIYEVADCPEVLKPHDPAWLYAVKVNIANNVVYLVVYYFSSDHDPIGTVLEDLQKRLKQTVDQAAMLIYLQRGYRPTSREGTLLREAIKRAVTPNISALITETKAKE